jgi:hypothetical protein
VSYRTTAQRGGSSPIRGQRRRCAQRARDNRGTRRALAEGCRQVNHAEQRDDVADGHGLAPRRLGHQPIGEQNMSLVRDPIGSPALVAIFVGLRRAS